MKNPVADAAAVSEQTPPESDQHPCPGASRSAPAAAEIERSGNPLQFREKPVTGAAFHIRAGVSQGTSAQASFVILGRRATRAASKDLREAISKNASRRASLNESGSISLQDAARVWFAEHDEVLGQMTISSVSYSVTARTAFIPLLVSARRSDRCCRRQRR
jgi:hypothetical protein